MSYFYPHDNQVGSFGGWYPQEYLPNKLKGQRYYQPLEAGEEKQTKAIYLKLKEGQNKK